MASLTREQFQVIRQLLDAHPEGQTIPDIRAVLGPHPRARTVRDQLEQLNGIALRIDASVFPPRYYALATANANFKSQISDHSRPIGWSKKGGSAGCNLPQGRV